MFHVLVKYLSEVDSCGEECLRLCNETMKICVTEGCRREWNVCKGNPTGPSLVGSPNWMPGWGESEPSHPGDALNEFSELDVSLAISNLWKVFDIYY